MIFVDSNIPMYLVGSDHPNKQRAVRTVEGAVLEGEPLVTDAEVFQEILHRYSAIDRLDAITPAFGVLTEMVDHIESVTFDDVAAARELLLTTRDASARDAIHVAVMHRIGCRRIMTFDRGFDRFPRVARIVAVDPDR